MPDDQQPPERRYVTYQQAADYFGVHVRTLERAVRDGTITPYRIGARAVRFDLRELEQQLVRPYQPPQQPAQDG